MVTAETWLAYKSSTGGKFGFWTHIVFLQLPEDTGYVKTGSQGGDKDLCLCVLDKKSVRMKGM